MLMKNKLTRWKLDGKITGELIYISYIYEIKKLLSIRCSIPLGTPCVIKTPLANHSSSPRGFFEEPQGQVLGPSLI